MDYEWDNIRCFVSLARHKRLTKAAAELRVEHTTVSRRIAQLEKSVGRMLFVRSSLGFSLTELGERFYAEAAQMDASAQALSRIVGARIEASEKLIKLAIVESLAVEWLAPKLAEFHRANPGVRVEILAGGDLSDILAGETHLAIRVIKPTAKELVYTRLATVAFALYGSRAVVQHAQEGPVPLLVFPDELNHLQKARWFQDLKKRYPPLVVSSSTLTLLKAARYGAGLAVLPRFMGDSGGDLVLYDKRDISCFSLWLISHPSHRKNPHVAAFCNFLKRMSKGRDGGLY